MRKKILLLASIALVCFLDAPFLIAQTAGSNADLSAKTAGTPATGPYAEISITPRTASFQEGSTFEVPIYINTRGSSINAIDLHVKFDPQKLAIVRPAGGTSIIGLWTQPPAYDNTKGTANLVGTIPNGITSNSGLIVTITFQAKAVGEAVVSIRSDTLVLLNNGLGTPMHFESNRGAYTILAKPPEGVQVYSETHPFQDRWYNNPNPVLTWSKDPDVTGFSFTLDDKPNTVPENAVTSADTIQSYKNLGDGPWYFHIKPLKRGVWGATTNFMVRIDTAPPAEFRPTIDYLSASAINRFLISFFTTDALSGIDHYEVGVIDKTRPLTEAPAFMQTESPYQLPFSATESARVIVRAIDRAGNVRDEPADIKVPFIPLKIITDNTVVILASLLSIIILIIIFHYLVGHKIIRRIKKIFALLRREEKLEQVEQAARIEEELENTAAKPSGIKIETLDVHIPAESDLAGSDQDPKA